MIHQFFSFGQLFFELVDEHLLGFVGEFQIDDGFLEPKKVRSRVLVVLDLQFADLGQQGGFLRALLGQGVLEVALQLVQFVDLRLQLAVVNFVRL